MDVSGQKRKLDLGGASALSAAPGGMHINPYTGRPFSAKYWEILGQRQKLPVWEQKDDFIQMVKKNRMFCLIKLFNTKATIQEIILKDRLL